MAKLFTAPHVVVEMLGPFVAFPIVFAAKAFVAFGERTAVGAIMAFHVLAIRMISIVYMGIVTW